MSHLYAWVQHFPKIALPKMLLGLLHPNRVVAIYIYQNNVYNLLQLTATQEKWSAWRPALLIRRY